MTSTLHAAVQSLSDKMQTSQLDMISIEDDKNSLEDNLKKHIECLPIEQRARVHDEFFGHGPMTKLLNDPTITEIIVNSWEQIWFERRGQFCLHDDAFLSVNTFENFVHRLSKKLKVQLTLETPFVCATDGDLRIHLVSPSITGHTYAISIRKHPQDKFEMLDLVKNKSMSQTQMAWIETTIKTRKNFLVIGVTGSGKTTFVNACLQLVPKTERLVIVEDTSELVIPNSLSTKILTRKDSHGLLSVVDLASLIKEALRMRPDRIVLGEVRGPEAKDLLLALSTGHEGSIGTLHAQSAAEALIRLEMLIQLGAPQWSLESIRKLIFLSLNYIITISRNEKGERTLSHIHKLSGMESFGLLLEEIHT